MQKNFYSKNVCRCLLMLLFVVASQLPGLAQQVHVYPLQYGENAYYPQAKNIAPGSNNNVIAVFGAGTDVAAAVTSIRVTTAGTYTPADIKPNGFKLWYTEEMYNPSSVEHAVLVASKAVVASGGELVFSGLTQQLSPFRSNFFFITADVAEEATMGRTLQLIATPLNKITLASGQLVGSTLPATATQTIGIPLPQLSIYSYSSGPRNISPGSTKNAIYNFQINVSEANEVLKSLTLPAMGTFTAADVAPNGFRLWHRAYYGNYEEVLAASTSLGANGSIVFSGMNVPLNRDAYGYGGHEFTVTVDMAPGATVGRTIGIRAFPLSNFTFERAGSSQINGPDRLDEGSLSTVVIPAIAIRSLGPGPGVVSPASVNNVLYKLNVSTRNASASFTSIRFTTGGTYQAADIARFKLYAGGSDYFERDALLGTVPAVASGNQVVFNLTDATLDEGDGVVLYLVADLAPGAVADRTIQIQAITPASIGAVSGTVTGTTAAGGVQTIAIPSVTFTPAGPPARKVSPGAFAVLHVSRVDVTGAPATFQSAAFQLSGTYQPADFNDQTEEDGIDGVYLVYHKTPNLLNELEEDDDEDLFLLGYANAMPASGGTLTFTQLSEDDSDFTPTIPLGTGYLTAITGVRATAVLGRTVQAASVGTVAINLASGTKSGTTGAGGVQTIGAPSITVAAVATPAANVAIGSPQALIYGVKIEATEGTAIPQRIAFTTGGTYDTHDVQHFELYYSRDAVFDRNNDNYIGSTSPVPSGGTLEFTDLDYVQINQDSPAYLYLVMRVGNATAGRTIYVQPLAASGLTFVSGTPVGAFPLPAGGIQTFVAPTVQVTMASHPAQTLAGGTNNRIVHRFNVAVTGADAYPEILMMTLEGTFEQSDMTGEGFKIWYNTSNSFAGSTLAGTFGPQGSGATVGASIHDVTIKAGTSGYFFITADIAATAQPGRTMHLQVQHLSLASGEAALPTNTRSAVHTIGQPATLPALALSFPEMAPAALHKGTADNVIYRFNVAATGANAFLNYISFYTGGSFQSSDLAANGLKLWYNTTATFAGSTLVHSFATDGSDGREVGAALSNVQLAAGSTGYFFITASVAASAGTNRTIRVEGIYDMQFAAGMVAFNGSTTGSSFTISSALKIAPDASRYNTQVYPNPYRQQETLTIETNSAQPKRVTIYGAAGHVVTTVEMMDTKAILLPALSQGMYLIRVQHLRDNHVEVKKLLVQ